MVDISTTCRLIKLGDFWYVLCLGSEYNSWEREFWSHLDLNSGLDFPTYSPFHFWPFTLLSLSHFPPGKNEGDNSVYLLSLYRIKWHTTYNFLSKVYMTPTSQEIDYYKNNMYKLFSAGSTCMLGQHSKHSKQHSKHTVQCLLITNYVHCMAGDTIRKRALGSFSTLLPICLWLT